jgi:20S proteasome alpha/beta subunit
MTVCIGAICDKGKTVVVCADRMMTFGPPMNLQSEGAVRKIFPLTDQCVLLFSGSVPDGEYIVSNSKTRIKAAQPQDIKTIASLVNAVYQEHKKKRAEDSILRPFLGIDFAGFQTLVGQSASSQVLTQLLGMVSQHNLQLDLMIAGVDGDGAHLLLVSHPGNVMSLDTVGTASIGSGGLHGAIRMSLARPTQDGSLAQAMHNVYEAKLASEVAPGVGKATDIAVINAAGHKFVDASVLKVLQEIHKDRPELDDTDLKKLTAKCEEYSK